jgi:DNA-nicking Smr family endonuclease
VKKNANPFDALDGRVDETLDLHGFSGIDVKVMIDRFLVAAQKRHPGGLLHVITGKGRGSAGRPVVKPVVRAALAAAPPTVVRTWAKDDHDGGFLVRLAGRR